MDRHQTPQPTPLLAPEAAGLPALEGDDHLAWRRCVRCRAVFEDLSALDIQGPAGKGWSLCGPCEAVAFPKRRRSSATLTIVGPLVDGQDGSQPS